MKTPAVFFDRRIPSIGLLAGAAALGLGLRADPLDDAVGTLIAKRHIPGMSIAIIKDGAIVKAKGYGMIEAGGTTPVFTDTLFQAGAISKSVAALGALHLVEAHRLSLDEDVNRTLLNWEVPANEYTKESKVTLRRLLSHSAGLTTNGLPGYTTGVLLPTLAQVLNGQKPAHTSAIRVDFEPGSKWRYTDSGYNVVQQLVFDVTGQPFPDFMRLNVLEPLGMKASSFEQPPSPARAALAATGHDGLMKAVPGRWQVYPELAAAGLWTTPSDLARFAIALQESFAGRASPVISTEMTRVMLTRQIEDDGLGLFLSGSDDTLRFDHGGRNEGFDAQLVAYAGSSLGAVIMINANDGSNTVSRVMEIIATTYGWPGFPLIPNESIEDLEPQVTAAVKEIFEQAQQGKVDRGWFTPLVGEKIAQQFTGRLGAEIKGYGTLQSIALIARRQQGDTRQYRHRMVFSTETILVISSYNKDGKIEELSFRPE